MLELDSLILRRQEQNSSLHLDIELRNTRMKAIRSFVTDKYKLYTETPLEVIDGKLTLSMFPNSFALIEIEELLYSSRRE